MADQETAGGCVFCAIVAGRAPATVLCRWRAAVAIRPLNPVTPGHTLVLPTQHVTDAVEDPPLTGYVMTRAAQYAGERFNQMNIITSVGAFATQTVSHLHLHIVPRRAGDGLHLPWSGQP